MGETGDWGAGGRQREGQEDQGWLVDDLGSKVVG
jgi:hypothetical protein